MNIIAFSFSSIPADVLQAIIALISVVLGWLSHKAVSSRNGKDNP